MLWIASGAISLVLLASSFKIIPTAHVAMVVRFRKRTGRVLLEGPRFVVPIIDQVEVFSIELETDPLRVSFVCADNVEVFIAGSLQWRPDLDIKYSIGRRLFPRFAEMNEETIRTGIADAVKSVLGKIGGVKNSRDFIENRRAIEDLVNCTLRLEFPPHLFPGILYEGTTTRVYDWIDLARFASTGEVKPEDQIDFYQEYARQIRELLDAESDHESNSRLETRYGIDIEVFALANVDLTADYKKALEAEKDAEAKARAADQLLELTEKFMVQGLNATEASNRAALALGLSNQTISSIEGGAIPFTNIPGGS